MRMVPSRSISIVRSYAALTTDAQVSFVSTPDLDTESRPSDHLARPPRQAIRVR